MNAPSLVKGASTLRVQRMPQFLLLNFQLKNPENGRSYRQTFFQSSDVH